MNEIEQAIEFMYGQRTQAANLYLRNTDERIIKVIDRVVAYYDLAIDSLRTEISREEFTPPKCYECKNEADSWECERCVWGDKSDRYESKGYEE